MENIVLDDLVEMLKEYNPEEIEIVKRAYEYADNLHKGQFRQSGEPYISHPLNVAYILAELHADRDTVCAGLLHDTLEDTKITKEDIAHDFNQNIANLVDEDAKTMYVKTMQVPDELIIDYYNLATDLHPDKIDAIQKLLQNGEVNPRDIKMHLARSIVSLYHTEEEVKEAEANFQAVYQKKNIEDVELPVLTYDNNLVDENSTYPLIDCIFSSGKYK